MPRKKRKLTTAQRKAKLERKGRFMIVFIGGKQKRVPRPPTIDGLSVEEFIARNADPIWLHQNGMWDALPSEPVPEGSEGQSQTSPDTPTEIPF